MSIKRYLKVLLVVTSICLFLAPLTFATFAAVPQYDEEHIVDVSKLKAEMVESTKPLKEKLQGTQLQQRFEAVFALLEQEELDNRDLKLALEELEQGIDNFRSDWNNIVEPLWDGQKTVGEVISKVRSLLASSQLGDAGKVSDSEIAPYENRLKKIAKDIASEPDPKRKERLELMFKNVYNLKRIKSVKMNLSPAQQVLLSRMLDALDRLELQFTRIIFTTEESYAILGNQQEFLKDYIQIVKGLIDIEDLAGWLAGGGSEGITSVEGLLQQFEGLNESISGFEVTMNKYSEQLIDSIEEHSQKIDSEYSSPVTSGLSDSEMDKLIQEYAGRED